MRRKACRWAATRVEVLAAESASGLTETATANKGFAATRFDAPQHVDINAFADDGIQLLEVKRELENRRQNPRPRLAERRCGSN